MIHAEVPNFSSLCSFETSLLRLGSTTFTIAHYNANLYDQYNGSLLTPWKSHIYVSVPLDINLIHRFCQTKIDDGTTWNVQRVGTFRSTGGYDWWQMSGADVARLKSVIQLHGKLFLVESSL